LHLYRNVNTQNTLCLYKTKLKGIDESTKSIMQGMNAKKSQGDKKKLKSVSVYMYHPYIYIYIYIYIYVYVYIFMFIYVYIYHVHHVVKGKG
jgi:hypothetical protein